MPLSDRELFARLIKCEAEGEGDIGMKAVATVVMNRVHVSYGEYQRICQGSLRKVIIQPFQFTCALTTVYGQYNPQNIYNMRPDNVHYYIADWALSGNKLPGIGSSLWYYNPFASGCAYYFPKTKTGVYITKIVQHCFYNPTPLYAKT